MQTRLWEAGTMRSRLLPKRPSLSPRAAQQGQSAVFVLLFLGILLISLNYLYKQGRITSDKMEMQNAADAIAYSISLTEARDLNFAAYMNRAMVANEVAIGQLLGLASWAYLWESYADWLNAYVRPLQEVPLLNAIPGVVYSFTSAAFRVPANSFFVPLLSTLANFGTSVLHYVNKFYGLAQFGYHTVTALFSIGTINEMLDQNAPPGTRISEYGILSLITHFATFGSVPLPAPPIPSGAPDSLKDEFELYVNSYFPTSTIKRADYNDGDTGDLEGFQRFAAIIRDSRDPFTLDRTWNLNPFDALKPIVDPIPLLSVDADGNINVDIEFDVDFFGLAGASFDLNFYFGIGVERNGGSELRIIVPSTGDFTAGEYANWSSADTSSLDARLGFSLDASVYVGFSPFRIECDFGGGADLKDEMFAFMLEICGFEFVNFSIPFPTSAPFGTAFTEAGITNKNDLKQFTTMPNFDNPVPNDAYGGAANRTIAWNIIAAPAPGPVPPAFTPAGVSQRSDISGGALYGDTKNRVNKKYKGLPQYIDTTGVDSTLFGFGAPNMTVSLVLDEEDHDLDRAQAVTDIDTAGNHPEMGVEGSTSAYADLRLTESMANNQLHAVARSEVYFSRPNDLDFFARLDGREEHGSAFNPYWNARLTEMRYVDSVAALLVQQQQDFTGASEAATAAIGGIQSLIDSLSSLTIDDFLP
ncbi:MAG: hypothetical protein ACI9BW_003357 [Gammaproteobacteria bacterium]|jgi:hypothetical protein